MAGALTAAIAAAFSGVTPDPYFEYTTLLLPGSGTNGAQNNSFVDSSANAFPITRNPLTGPNAPTQGTFSPFSQTGWSNYFDGSGDYLSVADNASLELGSSSFCIEVMYYATSLPAAQSIFNKQPNPSTDYGFRLSAYNGVLTPYISSGNTSDDIVNGTTFGTLQLNAWNHIAIYRVGTAIYGSLNGTITTLNASTSLSVWNNTAPWNIGATNTGTFGSAGYFSNWRIVIGSGVYTSSSAPIPTAPLTAITNTALLTCQSNRFKDNSSNNFTITPNADTRVVAFSPFNPSSSWSAATNGGSGYFDGNGDSLSGSFSLTTSTQNTFSFEGWIYPLASSVIIIGDIQPTGTSAVLYITLSASRNLEFSWYDGATKTATSTATLSLNQWNFFAVVVNAGAISIYVNSTTPGQTGTTTLTNRAASTTFGLGAYFNSGYLNGYVGSLRVSTSARTISAIPTEPYTSDANTKLLLNFTNAGIYDATSKNDLETVGNAQISTAQYKFPPSSMAFDGNGDYLFTPSSVDFVFNGDFTIEFWVYRAGSSAGGTGNYECLVATYNGSTGYGVWWLNTTNVLHTRVEGTTADTTTALSDSTWYHVAVTRSGSTVRTFVNGVQGSSLTSSATAANPGLYIGAQTVNKNFNGYIQDLRITKGYARYTANFTPPTAAFPTL